MVSPGRMIVEGATLVKWRRIGRAAPKGVKSDVQKKVSKRNTKAPSTSSCTAQHMHRDHRAARDLAHSIIYQHVHISFSRQGSPFPPSFVRVTASARDVLCMKARTRPNKHTQRHACMHNSTDRPPLCPTRAPFTKQRGPKPHLATLQSNDFDHSTFLCGKGRN